MLKITAWLLKISLGSTLLIGFFLLSLSHAAWITLPSGENVDLDQGQLERIKIQPGIHYVKYTKESIVPSKLTDGVIIEIPDLLGGGFLFGSLQEVEEAFNAVLAQSAVEASDNETSAKIQNQSLSRIRSSFSITGEYRVDALDWNIAGPIEIDDSIRYLNILSELTWTDLNIFQFKLANRTILKNSFFFKGHLSYGWILDGDNQDSDYACNDRTCEFSRSNNSTADDSVWDLSIGVGPHFTFGSDFFELSPLVGYSYHEQHLRITNGFQTIPPYGPFEGLDSTYETTWQGPWVGLDMRIQAMQPLGIFSDVAFIFSFEYHWSDYYAQADWNLRDEFAHPKSFEHEANGQGYNFSIVSELYYNAQWAFAINYTYMFWKTDPGIDRLFLADGTAYEGRLNEVNWRSNVFALGVSYRF